jgi:Icc-related predicted phosphoesterase
MIRVAAAGDLHFDQNSRNKMAAYLEALQSTADILLLAGDLTQTGKPEEAETLAEDLRHCPVPIVAVLGNHDYHSDNVEGVMSALTAADVRVLQNEKIILKIQGESIGIVGAKGFGGGFIGACGSEFGEPEMKSFIAHTRVQSEIFENHLQSLETDYKIALLHYSPTATTLLGEKKEIYPFLGSYYFAEAIDRSKVDIVFHGHAHRGVEKGETLGGIPVRNVAQPVIRHAFNIYTLNKESSY